MSYVPKKSITPVFQLVQTSEVRQGLLTQIEQSTSMHRNWTHRMRLHSWGL